MNYDKTAILKLARDSIASHFSGLQPKLTEELKKYSTKQGAFVTLTIKGRLRGCIGFPLPAMPLNEAIIEAAEAAAFSDPRFPPLQESELENIKIEISILSIPEEIKGNKEDYPKNIIIGQDGLIIKHPHGSGLLLPQVFTEYNATPLQALEMVCEKAGLPRDAWKESSSKLQKFQATIFCE